MQQARRITVAAWLESFGSPGGGSEQLRQGAEEAFLRVGFAVELAHDLREFLGSDVVAGEVVLELLEGEHHDAGRCAGTVNTGPGGHGGHRSDQAAGGGQQQGPEPPGSGRPRTAAGRNLPTAMPDMARIRAARVPPCMPAIVSSSSRRAQ
ncbi:hypothetical protein Shyhy02_43540 [Streptomyces hygroscopicus subsp. hygroscopicus]|nr:hypothetical protein Shyhy02_43540 [Streptomyces hygroscopicus subsp. hygroscopicus]